MSVATSKQTDQISLRPESPTQGRCKTLIYPLHETHTNLHVRCSLLVISL